MMKVERFLHQILVHPRSMPRRRMKASIALLSPLALLLILALLLRNGVSKCLVVN
jgi:hypothetical protein